MITVCLGEPLEKITSGSGLCGLAKMGMSGKIPFPAESPFTGTVKRGGPWIPMIQMLGATKWLMSFKISRAFKDMTTCTRKCLSNSLRGPFRPPQYYQVNESVHKLLTSAVYLVH